MNGTRIVIRVSADGSTDIKTEGFQGTSCVKATEELERALGLVSQRHLTSQFYQSVQGDAQQSVDASGQ